MINKPKLSTLLLITILTSSIILLGANSFCSAQTGTNVSYVISSDTTWTQAGSPYNLVDNLLVAAGATLTVQSGVTVNFNNYYMRVNGTLNIQPGATLNMQLIGEALTLDGVISAKGTSDNPIHINGGAMWHNFPTPFASTSYIKFASNSADWNPQTNTGSIVQNAVVNYTGFEVASGVKITGCNFQQYSDLTLLGGSPTVTGNTVACGFSLIYGPNLVDGSENPLAKTRLSCTVTNNTITDGLYIKSGSGTVSDNTISGGLTVSDESGDAVSTVIERNLIVNSSIGLTFNMQNSYNNQAVIRNNTITNNGVGIQINSKYSPQLSNNNIIGNPTSVKLAGQATNQINLPNNWWGTTDLQALNQTVWDYKNDFNLGTVNFAPALTAANPAAAPDPNAAITTPTPNPTANPTQNPTVNPTSNPTADATTNPTGNPTSTPTETSNPTAAPTPTIPEASWIAAIAVCVLLLGIVLLIRYRKPAHNP